MKNSDSKPARLIVPSNGDSVSLPDLPWEAVTEPTVLVFLKGAGGREQTLTRRQLYDLVYSKPMIYTADELGIAPWQLASLCESLDVPRLGRGYWRQVDAQEHPSKPPLSEPYEGPTHVMFRRPGFRRVLGNPLVEQADLLRAAELEQSRHIQVAENPNVEELHPLVRRTVERLEHATTDQYGRQSLKGTPACLDVRVGRATVHRAVALLDALVNALDERGFPVRTRHNRGRIETTVQILGVRVRWRLVEGTSRQEPSPDVDPDDEDLRPPPRSAGDIFSADLGLRLEVLPEGIAARYMGRRTWCDGKPDHVVESMLNAFIIGLITAALATLYMRELRDRRKRADLEQCLEEQDALLDSYGPIDEGT